MYVSPNFKTKKALKDAVAKGETVTVWQPNSDLFGPSAEPGPDGRGCAEGPHFPEPHKWYATIEWKDGKVVKVK